MKLSKGEHSILAYFSDSSKAESAATALKEVGIEVVQVDRVSRYGTARDNEINNPIAGRAYTITGLTLFSGRQGADNDERVLMAADPSVHGMASAGYGLAGGKAFLVTVVTDSSKLEKAIEILKAKGAYF